MGAQKYEDCTRIEAEDTELSEHADMQVDQRNDL